MADDRTVRAARTRFCGSQVRRSARHLSLARFLRARILLVIELELWKASGISYPLSTFQKYYEWERLRDTRTDN
jgi:hypothetical protein